MKSDRVIDSTTGRDDFDFNGTVLNVTENKFTDTILMFTKIGQHVKASSLIGHEFLSDTCVTIENNKVTDVGGPSQKTIDVYSRQASKTFSRCFPNLLEVKMDVFQ